uniref:Uncharacterized protein n=1 Tax=Tetranychus urticae TaxID=32264 RepID=T1KH37_TETUR
MLCHCTLIVWSTLLTRSVSSEPTSSNVNKTDKFVTLVNPKAKNTNLSQSTEALKKRRSIKDTLEFVKNVAIFSKRLAQAAPIFLVLTKRGRIILSVMSETRLRPGPFKYFRQRADEAWQHIGSIKYP